jgi:hypothetical protein
VASYNAVDKAAAIVDEDSEAVVQHHKGYGRRIDQGERKEHMDCGGLANVAAPGDDIGDTPADGWDGGGKVALVDREVGQVRPACRCSWCHRQSRHSGQTAAVTQTSAAVCGEEVGVEIALSSLLGGIDIDDIDVRQMYRVWSQRPEAAR